MKLSDVSMGQMDESEQEQLNGLGYLGQSGVDQLLNNPAEELKKLTDEDIAQMKKAYGERADYTSARRGVIKFDQLKLLMNKLGAEEKRRKAVVQAQQTALAKKTDAQPAQGPTASAAAPSYSAGYDWAALFKNPLYWVGVAAVVGVGAWWFMRSRRSAQPVGAVETLALEGTKKPRRKRRKSKKAKT